tara:strand:- start:24 stop:290 length:267 start_codon:yes stop_codon:yes gene_type:complete
MSDLQKENEILAKLFPNKIVNTLWFIGWCFIYKLIDMNTLQWFGKDMFIRGSGWGDFIGFFVASAFALSVVLFCLMGIYSLITGKKIF